MKATVQGHEVEVRRTSNPSIIEVKLEGLTIAEGSNAHDALTNANIAIKQWNLRISNTQNERDAT